VEFFLQKTRKTYYFASKSQYSVILYCCNLGQCNWFFIRLRSKIQEKVTSKFGSLRKMCRLYCSIMQLSWCFAQNTLTFCPIHIPYPICLGIRIFCPMRLVIMCNIFSRNYGSNCDPSLKFFPRGSTKS